MATKVQVFSNSWDLQGSRRRTFEALVEYENGISCEIHLKVGRLRHTFESTVTSRTMNQDQAVFSCHCTRFEAQTRRVHQIYKYLVLGICSKIQNKKEKKKKRCHSEDKNRLTSELNLLRLGFKPINRDQFESLNRDDQKKLHASKICSVYAI